MHHKPGEGREHLREALDAEAGLGDHDQVVEDPGAVEAARDSYRQGKTPGAHLTLRIADNEGSNRTLSQDLDGQFSG